MASYYIRGNTYWLKFRDQRGRIRREPTPYRLDGVFARRQVATLCAEKTLAEKSTHGLAPEERWDNWVPDYLAETYASTDQKLTLTRYQNLWANVRLFLSDKNIVVPRQLTRAHCLSYPKWRTGVLRNTALHELQFLGFIMSEAIAREYAGPKNPYFKLRLRGEVTREKPAFYAPQLALIHDGILAMPPGPKRDFFWHSFLIARHHGCRISATYLNPMTAVDLKGGEAGTGLITFHEKGNKIHSAPLHPALRPLFEKLQAEGRTETYEYRTQAIRSMWWGQFLRKIGIKTEFPQACFHSFRVTVITELALGGVSEAKAMAFVGHATREVHRIYKRIRPQDVEDVCSAIGSVLGKLPSPKTPDSPAKTPPPCSDAQSARISIPSHA